MSQPDEPVFGEWGPPRRVRVERGPVWVFARAVKDDNPVYASEEAARHAGFERLPCPPTFTFVMTHAGQWPDLQPEGSAPAVLDDAVDYTSRPGLYLHGEQEFVYHRQPLVGDLLEGRMRVSQPYAKPGSRRPMELTIYETRWTDPDGEPVVSERITSIFLPEGPP
jgi:hypothetical protein